MGYTTDFTGQVTVTPPLNASEIAYLRKFSESRRMRRPSGPYSTDNLGYDELGFDSYNYPPDGQPGLWCDWTATGHGTAIAWNGSEKFYNSLDWMTYLIDHFLKAGAVADQQMATLPLRTFPAEFNDFTFDHVLNGEIEAQGEDPDDHWFLVVENNKASKRG